MKRLLNWIATTGENPKFIAAMAHCWFAAFVVGSAHRWGLDVRIYVYLTVLIVAGIKEFYFDARYEKNPPQTTADNIEDFMGYVVGAAIGMWAGF